MVKSKYINKKKNIIVPQIELFALYGTSNEIFANQMKCKNFDNENEGQGQEREIGLVPFDRERFEVVIFPPEFLLLVSIHSCKKYHTYTHSRTLARLHTHTPHKYTQIHTQIHTYTHTHHTHTHTRTHARTHARTHTHTHTHTSADTHRHTHAHTQARAHARTHTLTHTHTQTQAHTYTHLNTHTLKHTERQLGDMVAIWKIRLANLLKSTD